MIELIVGVPVVAVTLAALFTTLYFLASLLAVLHGDVIVDWGDRAGYMAGAFVVLIVIAVLLVVCWAVGNGILTSHAR